MQIYPIRLKEEPTSRFHLYPNSLINCAFLWLFWQEMYRHFLTIVQAKAFLYRLHMLLNSPILVSELLLMRGYLLRRPPNYLWIVPLPNRVDLSERRTISFNVIVCHHSQLPIFVGRFRLILQFCRAIIIRAPLPERWWGVQLISRFRWLSLQSLVRV